MTTKESITEYIRTAKHMFPNIDDEQIAMMLALHFVDITYEKAKEEMNAYRMAK